MLGCKTFSLSQQGSLYPRLLQPILFLLQLHILQLPTDQGSKVLCQGIPTCLRPLQCCPANLPKAFLCHSPLMQSSAPQTAKWVTSMTTGFVRPVWPALLLMGLSLPAEETSTGTSQCFHTNTKLLSYIIILLQGLVFLYSIALQDAFLLFWTLHRKAPVVTLSDTLFCGHQLFSGDREQL